MNQEFRDRYWRQIEETIQRFGWAVQGVFPTPDSPGPSFCYTVGLHEHKLPELLVFSLPPEIGQRLLNDVAQHLLLNKTLGLALEGPVQHEDWPMSFYLRFVRAHAADEYATAALARSRGKMKLLQVVWPDKEGHLPWNAQASTGYLQAQPLLCDAPPGD